MKHILVTNDFPPKVGGIQTYLWELWSRLPPEDVTVVTAAHPEAAAWDRSQPYRIERVDAPVLVPGPRTTRLVNDLAGEIGAELVLLDPVHTLAPLASRLDVPYGVVVHGAEVVVPAALPGVQLLVRRTLRDAALIVAAGSYPAEAARRAAGRPVPTVVVPPGVDPERFHPLQPDQRRSAREAFGVDPDAPLVVSISRLVPRKGMDVLIRAAAQIGPRLAGLQVLVAGHGRDRRRLETLVAELDAPVRLVGSVAHEQLPKLYAMADVFAMLCRNRWGGLEQEGFGIVFLEAAACGVPQVAGRSGGVHDAVVDGETGLVVEDSRDVEAVAAAIEGLLRDDEYSAALGATARARAAQEMSHAALAGRLAAALGAFGGQQT